MPAIRQYRKVFLLLGACIALAGGARGAISAEPQRATTPFAAGGSPVSARNSMQRVDYAILPGGRSLIRLVFMHEPQERPSVLKTYHPAANLVLDFPDTANESGREVMEVGQRELLSIQLVSSPNRLRVTIKLARPVQHELEINGRELLITLHRPLPGV